MEGVKEVVIHCIDDGEPLSPTPIVRPIEGLHEVGPPPFLTKTFDMVEDPATDPIVSWSRSRNSFVVWDSNRFLTLLLPKYFKHANFSSFVRQLNTYVQVLHNLQPGFRKVDPDKWEFANEGFLGGQKHLLKTIKRRRNTSPYVQQQGGSCLELGHYGVDGEVEVLQRDCNLITAEVVKLRQQHLSSRERVIGLQARLQATERKQQQMMLFLAKALTNPLFSQSLMHQRKAMVMHQRKAMAGIEVRRKRRLDAADIGAFESNIGTFFSSALDNESSSEIKSPATNGTDSGIVDDNISWEQLFAEELIGEDENEASALGADLSEIDVAFEDLVEQDSDWTENLQSLVDQLDFLGSRP